MGDLVLKLSTMASRAVCQARVLNPILNSLLRQRPVVCQPCRTLHQKTWNVTEDKKTVSLVPYREQSTEVAPRKPYSPHRVESGMPRARPHPPARRFFSTLAGYPAAFLMG